MAKKPMNMSKYLGAFLNEAEDLLQTLNDSLIGLEKNPEDMELINNIFRASHTLKSSAAAMGFEDISTLAHSMEDFLEKLRTKEIRADKRVVDSLFTCFDTLQLMVSNVSKKEKKQIDTSALISKLKQFTRGEVPEEEISEGGVELAKKPETLRKVLSVRVGMQRLDNLMGLVGELLTNKMQLRRMADLSKEKELDTAVNQLETLLEELQYEVTQARMVPVGQVFNRFPRMVRDLAKKENKEVDFTIEGSDMQLDRTVLDKLGEPLIHLIRNAVDHGVELPEERKKMKKSGRGKIKLLARKERNSAIVEVIDDGQGYDLKKIKKIALEKGIVTKKEAETMSPLKLMQLPFDPRFTTTKKVTAVSGRGVGLNVVKTKIEELNGSVKLESVPGKGSTCILELPFTLAIMPCFLARVGNEKYAIPVSSMTRCIKFDETNVKTIEDNEVIVFEDTDIPLFRLNRMFSIDTEESNIITSMVIEKAGEKIAIVVDEILGKQDLTIKALKAPIKTTKGFAGAALLGDGSVILILDVNTLF